MSAPFGAVWARQRLANAKGRDKFPPGESPMKLRLAMIGVVAAAGVAQAVGATKPRTAPAKLAQTVDLENQRPVPLKSFEIVMAAKNKTAPEAIVGKLDQPLAAGGRTRFPITGARGCRFEARWAFDDAKDSGDVDLCNDAHIVFAD
ncbi:MAG: hypothetical protein FD139_1178 [Methylocystaceae bacterium]|nr:MAG: hypothetical protein FD172_1722 [Methylocystaceae bacterium]TXT46137.1 MAG: hypothetical protein FD139_1178 [Methylocystaceae bacterium]